MYVCPDCKQPLEQQYCKECRYRYGSVDGIPILLSKSPKFQAAAEIATSYDSIYRNQSNVWENQGRTKEFLKYFSSLLGQFSNGRFLEIGCGEGFLLASLDASEKFATDLSIEAIKSAQPRTQAEFSLALAERLPFPADYFDLVATVGVMEHFLDTQVALREIRRILKQKGHYVTLVHVSPTFSERIALKVSQYIFPKPRPVQLARWLMGRPGLTNSGNRHQYPEQPIQNKYTTQSGKECLEKAGFEVVDTIHTRKYPQLPLFNSFVVTYICQKP